jgi:hypothetical protein
MAANLSTMIGHVGNAPPVPSTRKPMDKVLRWVALLRKCVL